MTLRSAHRWERRKHYKEYLLPIPKPNPSAPTELYLTMAYEPYDQIVAGEKVTEFRAYCETWVKRILANRATLKTVKFQRGYGGPGRPKPEQMVWTIRNIELYDIETRESSDPVNVKEGFTPTHIAIDLGERVKRSDQADGPISKPKKRKLVSTVQRTSNSTKENGMKCKVIVADNVPDETLWSVAAQYDFVALAKKLPKELVRGSVMRYAEKLNGYAQRAR